MAKNKMSIAIINVSTVLSDSDGIMITKGLNIILPQFCKDWDLPLYTASYIPKGKSTNISLKVYVLDTADIQGALGYHDISNNRPYGKCFIKTLLQNGGTMLYSINSRIPTFAQVISHEVFELLVDPIANSWWDTGDGQTLYASEVCDPVQGNVVIVNVIIAPSITTYSSALKKNIVTPAITQNIGLSDWILPAWSQAQNSSGPFNHLNTLKKPFTLDKGGYGIIIRNSNQGQVFAVLCGSEVTEEQKRKYCIDKERVSKKMF